MEALQWIVAAITSALVAWVAFLQWRTAQQKAVQAWVTVGHSAMSGTMSGLPESGYG